jgi:hypothetical protein
MTLSVFSQTYCFVFFVIGRGWKVLFTAFKKSVYFPFFPPMFHINVSYKYISWENSVASKQNVI